MDKNGISGSWLLREQPESIFYRYGPHEAALKFSPTLLNISTPIASGVLLILKSCLLQSLPSKCSVNLRPYPINWRYRQCRLKRRIIKSHQQHFVWTLPTPQLLQTPLTGFHSLQCGGLQVSHGLFGSHSLILSIWSATFLLNFSM